MTALLPCPFCGSEAHAITRVESTAIECSNDQCVVVGPVPFNDFTHRADAVQAWNRRALVDDLIEALSIIERAPAWGAPERWETTPAEVRQIARAALAAAQPKEINP